MQTTYVLLSSLTSTGPNDASPRAAIFLSFSLCAAYSDSISLSGYNSAHSRNTYYTLRNLEQPYHLQCNNLGQRLLWRSGRNRVTLECHSKVSYAHCTTSAVIHTSTAAAAPIRAPSRTSMMLVGLPCAMVTANDVPLLRAAMQRASVPLLVNVSVAQGHDTPCLHTTKERTAGHCDL